MPLSDDDATTRTANRSRYTQRRGTACTSGHASGQVNPGFEPTTGSFSANTSWRGASLERHHTDDTQSHQCLRAGSIGRGKLEKRTRARPDQCRDVGGNTSQSCQERREGTGGVGHMNTSPGETNAGLGDMTPSEIANDVKRTP